MTEDLRQGGPGEGVRLVQGERQRLGVEEEVEVGATDAGERVAQLHLPRAGTGLRRLFDADVFPAVEPCCLHVSPSFPCSVATGDRWPFLSARTVSSCAARCADPTLSPVQDC